MHLYAVISSLVNFVTAIILCLAILSKDKRTKLDLLFIVLGLSLAVWSFGYFFWQIADSASEALFWSRFLMAGAIGIGIFYLNFIFELLGEARPRRALLIFSDVLFALFLFFDFTKYFISGIKAVPGFAFWPAPGPVFNVFIFAWVVYMCYTTWMLYLGYKKSDGVFKLQIKYVLAGCTIGVAGGLTNYFLWYGINIPPWGNILASVFIASIFYSIIKYKFFNVKVIGTEIFVLALIVNSVWQAFSGPALQNIYVPFISISLTMLVGGLLIKSVLGEVRAREQLQVLSARLEDANKQLKQLDKAKSEFLSVASHQLRTPMTAIKGYVSMLLEGDFGEIPETQKAQLHIVYESAERQLQLVADLLDLSRIESGRMEFAFGPVNLCKLVENVLGELTAKAKLKGLYLYFDNVNRFCPDIRADMEKLMEVVTNLVDNAIKYTKQGGVTVRLLQDGQEIQLSVEDTGIGIAKEDQPKIFEKFFRTDAANEVTREGTGLGVYVVKKIVEAHGGKVWFTSQGLGKGTKFVVSFLVPKLPIKEEKVNIASLEAL